MKPVVIRSQECLIVLSELSMPVQMSAVTGHEITLANGDPFVIGGDAPYTLMQALMRAADDSEIPYTHEQAYRHVMQVAERCAELGITSESLKKSETPKQDIFKDMGPFSLN